MSPTNGYRKKCVDGKWYRLKDGRLCCMTSKCINVIKNRNLCMKHLGLRPQCQFMNCTKNPSYNYDGERKGIFCFEHKVIGMRNVVSKTCNYHGCETQASFNFPGTKIGKKCMTHAEEGMIHVIHKKCIHPSGCLKRPFYGYADELEPRMCSFHKTDDMVNISTKKCAHEGSGGCDIQPCYNYPGHKNGMYCKKHKLKTMINVKTRGHKRHVDYSSAVKVTNGQLEPTSCNGHIDEAGVL